MAKRYGYSAAMAGLSYIVANSNAFYITGSGGATGSALATTNGHIVCGNISGANFSIASGAQGPVLTVAAKNSQTIHGSGTGTHIYLVSTSAGKITFVTEMASQVLSSGGTVNIAAWTVTANQTANNSS